MHPYPEKIRKCGAVANNTFITLGIIPISFGDGEAELELNVTEKLHNGAGVLQGGFYTVLGDEAIALAIHSDLDAGENAVTITETTEFLKSVTNGTIIAHAKITKKGNRIIFAVAEIREKNTSGKLLARTTASYLIV